MEFVAFSLALSLLAAGNVKRVGFFIQSLHLLYFGERDLSGSALLAVKCKNREQK